MARPKVVQAESELVRLGARRIETADGSIVVIVPEYQGAKTWSFTHYQDGKPIATSKRTGLKNVAEARDELETICEDYRS
jgi:hypothetical protein